MTVSWFGEVAKSAVRDGGAAGLERAARALMEASKAIAPKDTTDLAGSAGVDVDAAAGAATVYFDPKNRPIHAIIQHEDLSYRHPAGESAKYLEKPLRAAGGATVETIAAELRGRL